MSISPFTDLASKIIALKKTEMVLPIAMKTATVSALLVGDDLSLKTSVSSPVSYDRDFVKMLHGHTEFVEKEETIRVKLDQFNSFLSNIDKLCLIWALYKSTYDILDKKREITCDECSEKSEFLINMDDLIHEDTITVWDKDVPFYQYEHVIECEYDDYIYKFHTKLPSIKDNNTMLNLISIDVLQNNMEKIGSIFTKGQRMGLLTNKIELYNKSNPEEIVETQSPQEILIAYDRYIPHSISGEFFEKYSEHFDHYVPNFYFHTTCPKCGKEIKYNVDLELEFFRKCVLN